MPKWKQLISKRGFPHLKLTIFIEYMLQFEIQFSLSSHTYFLPFHCRSKCSGNWGRGSHKCSAHPSRPLLILSLSKYFLFSKYFLRPFRGPPFSKHFFIKLSLNYVKKGLFCCIVGGQKSNRIRQKR